MYDGEIDVIARLDDPFVEPHPQPRITQALRQPLHLRFVFGIMA